MVNNFSTNISCILSEKKFVDVKSTFKSKYICYIRWLWFTFLHLYECNENIASFTRWKLQWEKKAWEHSSLMPAALRWQRKGDTWVQGHIANSRSVADRSYDPVRKKKEKKVKTNWKNWKKTESGEKWSGRRDGIYLRKWIPFERETGSPASVLWAC